MFKKIVLPVASLALAASLLAPGVSHAEVSGVTSPEKGGVATPEVNSSTNDPIEVENVKVTPGSIEMSPFYIYDPGGWQSRGKYKGYAYTGDDTFYYTPVGSGDNWKSGGGNFKIEFTAVNNSFTVQLREYDGINNFDEIVGDPIRVTGNSTITWSGITNQVDGSDDEAEFYITTYNAAPYQASFYAEGFD
mgnify:CR=1 FL=1